MYLARYVPALRVGSEPRLIRKLLLVGCMDTVRACAGPIATVAGGRCWVQPGTSSHVVARSRCNIIIEQSLLESLVKIVRSRPLATTAEITAPGAYRSAETVTLTVRSGTRVGWP